MSAISELYSLSSVSTQVNHSDQIKTSENKDRKINPPNQNEIQSQDKVQISDAAKDLLKMKLEATQYVTDVEKTKTISEDKLNELKQKIAEKTYLTENVIEQTADKLTNLPNYI